MKRFVIALSILLAVCIPASAGSKTSKKSDTGQAVDAGSFTAFVNGKKVATETFRIDQREGYSTTTAQVKMEDGSNTTLESELQISSNGILRKYEWRELSPGKARADVAPSDQFIVEHVTTEPGAKPAELAFLLPPSTMIVDDYFFSHREILLWRYIAAACTQAQNNQCKMDKTQFGIFVPRQQTPTSVTLEYKGREKVQLKGAERELDRFDLAADGLAWSFWVDAADSYKLQRIVIASENTEVVRD